MPVLPRLRQAVIAAHDLDGVAGELHAKLGLGEPYSDPGVAHFGLRNAVFALGDTFLEVVSPIRSDASAARLLERRGGDTGYMLMFQVEDLEAARERVRGAEVREVLDISLDDIAEVHLHPADMRAAIVSLSRPQPPAAWRWGGPGWEERSAPYQLTGATITVAQPVSVGHTWQTVLGTELVKVGIRVRAGEVDRGLTEIVLAAHDPERVPRQREPPVIGGVRVVVEPKDAVENRFTPSVYEETQ
jgi:hypothetical protein